LRTRRSGHHSQSTDALRSVTYMMSENVPDVRSAAGRLAGKVVRTPVIRSAYRNGEQVCRLWLKAENLQHTGSYKFRGARLAVDRVADRGGARRVITQSSGNHGIAVAVAARERGLQATVVLPFDASPAKVAQIKSSSAEVVQTAASVEECRTVVEELQRVGGGEFIDVRGDADVIAGQGTASLELLEDVPELDALIVPTASGCGLAGAVLAAEAAGRRPTIYGAEPLGCGSLTQSLEAGDRVSVEPEPSIADALAARCQGGVPFEIFKNSVVAVAVDDLTVTRAFGLALFGAKLLLEPSGAVGLAAAMNPALAGRHRDIGVILTGGNVSPLAVAELAQAYEAGSTDDD
jgi:threo-3-hydroxy-L-aspartate ammonia-lyase